MATETAAPAPEHQRTRAERTRRLLIHLGLIGFGLIMLYPLLWMLSSSFKPTAEIFREPGLIPWSFTPENYTEGWNALQHPFHRYLLNSAIVVGGAIIGNLIGCSMAAYAFARLEFRGKRLFFAIMLATIMLPIHVVIVPQYILFAQLDWINTFYPLIVPKLLATDGFFIFLMVQFIRGLPRHVHGAGGAAHLRRLQLPDLLGAALRDVGRGPGARVRLLPGGSALPGQGHRDHRNQVEERKSPHAPPLPPHTPFAPTPFTPPRDGGGRRPGHGRHHRQLLSLLPGARLGGSPTCVRPPSAGLGESERESAQVPVRLAARPAAWRGRPIGRKHP